VTGGGQLAGSAAGDLPSLASLLAALPGPMRQPRFAPASLPPRFAGAIRHGGPGREVDLSPLPARMRQETAWCLFRIIEIGGTVAVPAVNMLARRLGEAVADHEDGRGQPASLLDLPVQEWTRRIAHAVHRRTGRLPAATTIRNTASLLARVTGLLSAALDTGPWWRRDEWNPVEDGRIPLREHEPMGRYTVRFGQITTGWLRAGAQWHCKTGLETGTLAWSTVHRRVSGIREFDAFLSGRQVSGPALADGPAAVRALMLEFLARVRSRPASRGRRAGKPLTASAVASLAGEIEQFYMHMIGSKDDAAAALGDPRWLALGPEHHGFYRRGELPVPDRPPLEGQVISADSMTQIMAGAGLLGAPSAGEGYGDEQAMRITLLAALLGRRINEICMLDPGGVPSAACCSRNRR